jgi:biopolymer transport protein TolQ
MNPLDATSLGAPAGDMSVLSLFLQADFVVKLVIIGLILASVWTWAIVFEKFVLFQRTRRQMDRFESAFWSGHSLEELYRALAGRTNHAMDALFVAAMRERAELLGGSFSLESEPGKGTRLHVELPQDRSA